MTSTALTSLSLSVILGTALALGLCCLLSLVPRWGAPSLERRIAPYVRDVSDASGSTVWTSGASAFSVVWRSALASGGSRVSSVLGGSDVIARRLAQAGVPTGVERFRARQLGWGLAGVLVGGVIVVAVALAGRGGPALAVLPPLAGLLGAVLCDLRLQAAARARMARVQEELPAVLEFLSLCLAAGEGILDSVRRVSAIGVGELSGELRVVVLDVGTGSSLGVALGALSSRLQLPALTRSVDQLVAAIERGSPLAHVLQAQANDAREDAKRLLIERAGRSEIAMLVPLVFLILPLSVIFAVYPGIFMLRLGLG